LFDLIRELKRKRVGIVYVSHRLDEIAGLVDRVTVLRDGRSMGTFAADDIDRRKIVSLITGHDAFPTRSRQSAKPYETPLLVIKQLSRNGEFEDISIDVRCGEIVVITGLIGSGRTELLETLFRARRQDTGEIFLDGRRCDSASVRSAIRDGIVLIPEDRRGHGLCLILPMYENIAMAIMRRSDSSIIDVNVRWESMFGYSRAQAVGRTTAELEVYANPKDHQTYDDLAAAQGYVRDFEVDLRDRTGRVHHAVIAAEIVEVGGVPCFIETIRDVTEKKRAEREARDQQKQITHLTRVALIGELSGALAHELNQPLTAILSNAQAAQHYLEKGRIDPKELREILGDIVAQDRRAGEVIRRLRALFKKGETQFQALDANELVREVLELAHSDLITRNIEVVTRASPQLPAMLGDRVELQQVLLNLIVNACEAMSADGPKEHALTIRTESAADGVQLSVIDHGPGIPADMQERLFEPFFTTKPQGLGLGLSISRSIITAHRGRIWGTNNPDRGATFHIVLPVHAEGTS